MPEKRLPSNSQFVQQLLGLFQIERIVPFSEPTVQWSEKIASLILAARLPAASTVLEYPRRSRERRPHTPVEVERHGEQSITHIKQAFALSPRDPLGAVWHINAFAQIARIVPFSKPSVDRREQIEYFVALALIAPEACEARRGEKPLPGLASRNLQRRPYGARR
jgi:hypothetical protein